MADSSQDVLVGQLPGGTKVLAASQEHGRSLLTDPKDPFIQQQSQFDRQARVQLSRNKVTLEIYLDYVSSQVMSWSASEIAALRDDPSQSKLSIIGSVGQKFDRLDYPLPDEIFLVKTTGLEEGYAAYTRKKNIVALPANMVASLESAANFGDPLHAGGDTTYLENVIIHELFHLFSKNNPKRRGELYELVHYYPTGNDIELPNVAWPLGSQNWMPDMKITNPDTPALNVYINMEVPEVPGSDGSNVTRALTPVLLASGEYTGGSFFQFLDWLFMAVEENNGEWTPVVGSDDRPLMYERTDQFMAQYLSLIGRNLTGELFHPDEIMAQSFVLVVNQPDMSLLSGIDDVLKR